jgi:hypothetical protein
MIAIRAKQIIYEMIGKDIMEQMPIDAFSLYVRLQT